MYDCTLPIIYLFIVIYFMCRVTIMLLSHPRALVVVAAAYGNTNLYFHWSIPL